MSLTLNLCISNVPGPKETLRGVGPAPPEPRGLHPGQSMALNISAHSYDGSINLGFIGYRDGTPHLQRLAVHTGGALAKLESAPVS